MDWKHLFQILKPIVTSSVLQSAAHQINPKTDVGKAIADIDRVMAFAKKNPELVSIASSIAASAIAYHKANPGTIPDEVAKPLPEVEVKPVVPPEKLGENMSKTVTAINLKLRGAGEHSKSGELYDKDHLDAFRSLSDPLKPGDKAYFDASPVDQNGTEFLGKDPAAADLNISWNCSPEGLELHQADHDEQRNYGLTPFYKIPVDFTGEQTFTVSCTDGKSGKTSNAVQFRVKG